MKFSRKLIFRAKSSKYFLDKNFNCGRFFYIMKTDIKMIDYAEGLAQNLEKECPWRERCEVLLDAKFQWSLLSMKIANIFPFQKKKCPLRKFNTDCIV